MENIRTVLRDRRTIRWALLGTFCVSLLIALVLGADHVAERRAKADLNRRAAAAAALHSAVLRSELEKFRLLPIVLTEDHDVRAALEGDGESLAGLNEKLESLSQRTRAGVIYILDTQGRAIVASNWRRSDSFVGADYSFRPYFRDALAGRPAEHFALGAISGKPGLFFARRVETNGRILGVVVVKLEFDHVEQEWRGSADPAFVTDSHEVVLLTSVPAWRFHTVKPLSEADRTQLRSSQQFGTNRLDPLPFDLTQRGQIVEIGAGSRKLTYVAAAVPTAAAGWTLHLLTPANGAIDTAVNSARAVAFAVGLVLMLIAFAVVRVRERAGLKAAAEEQVRAQLEVLVSERTHELSVSNERLVQEMAERRRVEASRQTLQDELVQASKLATLGQIAAGVAHEINQPVAAIRSFADNATILIKRQDADEALENLDVIAGLTDRIGAITGELRAFSRKTSAPAQPVDIESAIAGAVLLIGPRARQLGVTIVRQESKTRVSVMADRVRLEQVLVNLLQNAIEALADQSGGVVALAVKPAGRRVRVAVSDNGPGLPADVVASLFTPFVTTKPNGLGLGLVISRDLVGEFGGELTLEESAGGGAKFVISLRKAA